jgi:hypothetical protein
LPKLLVVALCAGAISAAMIPQTAWTASAGIRHRVTAKLLPFSNPVGVSRSAQASSSHADLRIFVQISDHAIDSRFYGTAEARFADVDPSIGADEAVVWEDARCHRERGIPKISLVRIDGAIRNGDKTTPLTAVGRQIGLRVPADEIIERKGAADDNAQTLMIIDATTKASGIAVRIRLTGEPCAL